MSEKERPIFDPNAEDPKNPAELTRKLREEIGIAYRRDADRKIEETELSDSLKDKIPEWTEAGKDLRVDPEEWSEMIDIRVRDIYKGVDVENSIEIMKALAGGATQGEVEVILADQGQSGLSYGVVRSIVSYFSEDGKKFFEEIERES